MDFGQLLSSGSTLVALLACAWVGMQTGRLTNLKNRGEDLAEQLGDARSQIEDLKAGRSEDKATIAQQASDIAALQRVVTGEVHWLALGDTLDHHHQLAEKHWKRDEELLEQILHKLRGPA